MKTLPIYSILIMTGLFFLLTSCSYSGKQQIPGVFGKYIFKRQEHVEYKEITPCYGRTFPIPESISKNQALEDLETLQYLFSTSYSGYNFWKAKGIDFDTFFEQEKEFLLPYDSIHTIIFEKRISALLKHFTDGHIAIEGYGYNYAKGHKSVYFSDIILEKTPGDDFVVRESLNPIVSVGEFLTEESAVHYLFPTLSPPGKQHYLLGYLSHDYVQSRNIEFNGCKKEVPFHDCRLIYARHDDHQAYYTYRIEKTPIIRINSFMNRLNPEMQEFIQSGSLLNKEKRIIIDLMDNGGGSSEYPVSFIKNLNGTVNWRMDWANLLSPPITQYFKHYPMSPNDTYSEGFRDLVKTMGKQAEAFQKTPEKRWTFFSSGEDNFQGTFDGQLIVLANRRVISGGEALVGSSACIKDRILIGENTGGVAQFSSTCDYYLPHSKIIVKLPRQLIFIPGLKESVGYKPDYWLDSEEPMKEIIKWIINPDDYCFSYPCSYHEMLESKLNNIVLPEDVDILKPGPEIPEDISVYSGIWFGIDGGVLEHLLIVEEIHSLDNIKAIYAWGSAPQWGVKPGWQRLQGSINRGSLILCEGDLKISYTNKQNRSLYSLFEKPGVTSSTQLIKIEQALEFH